MRDTDVALTVGARPSSADTPRSPAQDRAPMLRSMIADDTAPTCAYPPDLARWVLAHWPTGTPCPVSGELLLKVLATAFQVELLPLDA